MSHRNNLPSYSPAGTFGKIPPQDVELEEIVLGGLLIDNTAFIHVVDILHEEVFYKDIHQRIFKAMKELYANRMPIDIMTVVDKLKKLGDLDTIGGPSYIVGLTSRIGSATNIRFHVMILKEHYIRRKGIIIAMEMIKVAYDDTGDPIAMVGDLGISYYKLMQEMNQHQSKKTTDIVRAVGLKIKETMRTHVIPGIETGFTLFDQAVLNLQAGNLVIVAARPGMGKTAFLLSILKNISITHPHPKKTAVSSLEMGAEELVQRLLSMISGVNSIKIRKGDLSEHEIDKINTAQEFINENLLIDDQAAINVEQFRAKAIQWVSQGVELVAVDYLQLMEGMGEKTREAQISGISRGLKAVAKELRIPIIALSQLSRQVEGKDRKNKKPQLSDLRESGAIEQDADIVIFIFRPDYYKEQEEKNRDMQGYETQQEAELIIAKQRNGPTGSVYVLYDGRLTLFMNMPRDEPGWVKPDNKNEF